MLIKNVAVLPRHQGKGLGSRLLDHAERLAAGMGYAEIKLYTNERYAGNVAFYERLGYQVEREEDFMGGITIYMNKAI